MVEEKLNGYQTSSYFNVDVPGRTLQMPQIMSKAGIENLVISRHERGLFYWESPDVQKFVLILRDIISIFIMY